MLPGNAILLNGVVHTANREIGVPGWQPRRFAPKRKYSGGIGLAEVPKYQAAEGKNS
jgi:hypothetical protein